MTKNFCDICGEEIVRNYVSDRFSDSLSMKAKDGTKKIVAIEITIAIEGHWNKGEPPLRKV